MAGQTEAEWSPGFSIADVWA